MWRDVLLVSAWIIALLTYFGVTPQRIKARFARTAASQAPDKGSTEVPWPFSSMEGSERRFWLVTLVVVTGLAAIVGILGYSVMPQALFAYLSWHLMAWWFLLTDMGRLSVTQDTILLVAGLSLAFIGLRLSQVPVLESIADPLGGGVLIGLLVLLVAVRVRRRTRSPHASED